MVNIFTPLIFYQGLLCREIDNSTLNLNVFLNAAFRLIRAAMTAAAHWNRLNTEAAGTRQIRRFAAVPWHPEMENPARPTLGVWNFDRHPFSIDSAPSIRRERLFRDQQPPPGVSVMKEP